MFQIEYVHYFGRGTFDRLQNHVVAVGLVKLHNGEERTPHFVLIWLLTEFTFNGLPEVAGNFLTLVHYALAVEPFLETANMDLTHGARALAWYDKWVVLLLLGKTDTAH